MDCDGLRQLLMTDVDGSFSGKAGNTIIPKAEYQWGGDPGFGLGTFIIIIFHCTSYTLYYYAYVLVYNPWLFFYGNAGYLTNSRDIREIV